MIIVLDTTETYKNFYLDGAHFTMLRNYLNTHPATLVVPGIVVEETIRHFEELCTDTLDNAGESLNTLRTLVPDFDYPSIQFDTPAATEAYRHSLEEKLRELRAEQTPFDDIRIDDLVRRALHRRKPFDANGQKGFRDALIWETVLTILADRGGDVVLVTRNYKDFGHHGDLEEDLRADLMERGFPQERVRICEGLPKLVEEYVKPRLEKLETLRQEIESGSYGEFNVYQFFQKHHFALQREAKMAADFKRNEHLPTILGIRLAGLAGFDVTAVWNVNEAQIAVGLDLYTSASLHCARKSKRWYAFLTLGEEYYYTTGNVTLKVLVILNRDNGEVVQWEMTEVDAAPES
jgi:hypothetical protein